MGLERFYGLLGQFVLTKRTHCYGVVLSEELSCVISEIGGCTTQFLAFGKHIPEGLAESDDITFLLHDIIVFSILLKGQCFTCGI